jgi:hypothetical protein
VCICDLNFIGDVEMTEPLSSMEWYVRMGTL